KLVDADWYFKGSEAEAAAKANAKARQWELLVTNWEKTEKPTLALLGEPYADVPHWTNGGGRKRTPQEIQAIRQEGRIDADEFAKALSEFTFTELISVYEQDRREDLSQGHVQNTSVKKAVSQMKQAALFLDNDLPAVQLAADHFRKAKAEMLKQVGRRTARNYLGAALTLLRWIYRRYGGNDATVPPSVVEACTVPNATKTDIQVYGLDELKKMMQATAGTISQLDLMMGLNCAMYEADLGRLRRDEIDLHEGGVFWDREKEPQNEFKVHHVLWPETLLLVKRYLHDGSSQEVVEDFRYGEDKRVTVKAAELAFLDLGRPRYRITRSGHAYDLVGRRWGSLVKGYLFHNLRKSANDILCNLIEHGGADEELQAVEEVSKRFMGQKTPALVRLYRTNKKGMYVRMNKYLARLGEYLRAEGVFQPIRQAGR
ncbi:MAG: hypothetical protein ACM359_11755, partial [Bacillota bacterium]